MGVGWEEVCHKAMGIYIVWPVAFHAYPQTFPLFLKVTSYYKFSLVRLVWYEIANLYLYCCRNTCVPCLGAIPLPQPLTVKGVLQMPEICLFMDWQLEMLYTNLYNTEWKIIKTCNFLVYNFYIFLMPKWKILRNCSARLLSFHRHRV